MTGNGKKNNSGIIEELIDAEEKVALAKFRSGRFLERLEERIESAAPPAVRPYLFRGVPRAVWVSAATLAIVGGALFMLRLLRTPAPGGSAVVESYLRRLPGIQAIETRPRAFSETPLPMSSFDRAISDVLSSPAAGPGRVRAVREGRGFSSIDPLAKPLGLQELYEILVANKSVERVLAGISQKTKEG
jgi:hypothetical protein